MDIENTGSNNNEDAQFHDDDDVMMIKAKMMNQMNQVKLKRRNLILVMWSGLNMVGFGILLKYVLWMMHPAICNIGFVYKITKLLLNGSDRTTSH